MYDDVIIIIYDDHTHLQQMHHDLIDTCHDAYDVCMYTIQWSTLRHEYAALRYCKEWSRIFLHVLFKVPTTAGHVYYIYMISMMDLLGWLETRLAQITLNYLNINYMFVLFKEV